MSPAGPPGGVFVFGMIALANSGGLPEIPPSTRVAQNRLAVWAYGVLWTEEETDRNRFMKRLELAIESIILASRWLLVVFYLGLGVALAIYALSFGKKDDADK